MNYPLMSKVKPTFMGLDLFAGAGGMSLGARGAGITIPLAIEKEKNAAATYRYNHPDTNVLVKDICKIRKKDIAAAGLLPDSDTRLLPLVVFGGPPCRGFSTSNQRTRSKSNPNNWLFKEYFRLVRLTKPEWVVFENVKGLVETEGGHFLESILSEFKKIGYVTSMGIVNAADVGVPQRRWRLFIIGSILDKRIDLGEIKSTKTVNVDEAIADLPLLDNGANMNMRSYRQPATSNFAKSMRGNLDNCTNHLVTRNAPFVIERYKYVKQGGNWEDIPLRLMKAYTDRSRCHTGIYHRLDPSQPSKVIGNYRKNMMIHPYQDRGLSVREAARLQSFPDWYEFRGSIGFQQQQVGNAVPPLLAKKVFELLFSAT